MPDIRDRVKELRHVRAGDLVPNPSNWRLHPPEQAAAMRAILDEIGYAATATVRELEDGRLMLLDGLLRADLDPDAVMPVVVVDLTEEEADKFLVTFDPVGQMAGRDTDRLKGILDQLAIENREFAASLEVMHPPPPPPSEPRARDARAPITYQIVFDNEEQQTNWFAFLRNLRDQFPEVDSIAGRLNAHIGRRVCTIGVAADSIQ